MGSHGAVHGIPWGGALVTHWPLGTWALLGTHWPWRPGPVPVPPVRFERPVPPVRVPSGSGYSVPYSNRSFHVKIIIMSFRAAFVSPWFLFNDFCRFWLRTSIPKNLKHHGIVLGNDIFLRHTPFLT